MRLTIHFPDIAKLDPNIDFHVFPGSTYNTKEGKPIKDINGSDISFRKIGYRSYFTYDLPDNLEETGLVLVVFSLEKFQIFNCHIRLNGCDTFYYIIPALFKEEKYYLPIPYTPPPFKFVRIKTTMEKIIEYAAKCARNI